MQLGEVVFGGVGAGLYGMLVMVVLTVFIAGLMVGRTPEYLGKKIQAREVQMAMLYVLVFPAAILGDDRRSRSCCPPGSTGLNNAGPARLLGDPLRVHVDVRPTTAAPSPGSRAATYYYNTMLGVAMLIGRFAMIVPMLALAGFLAEKKIAPENAGTFPVTGAALRRAARRRDPHRRRAHLLSRRSRSGPIVEHLSMTPGGCSNMTTAETSAVRSADRPPRAARRVRQARPAPHGAEPGDVRRARSAACSRRSCSCATSRSGRGDIGFTLQIALWLWFTVLFANFAEAMAEGRGKAQADTLRSVAHADARRSGSTIRASTRDEIDDRCRRRSSRAAISCSACPATSSRATARSSKASRRSTSRRSPASRRRSSARSGGDRSAVTGGTKVLSDYLVIRITANPGETFLDRMIALVEGASRQKTPNEIALTILLSGLTIIFLFAVVTLQPFAHLQRRARWRSRCSIALLVCLIPTTIGGLLSAIGIAGMDRMIQQNVIAMSGRAVEAAGDVNTLLLDKTGTITLGNRQAVEFIPVSGRRRRATSPIARSSRRCPTRRRRAGASSCWRRRSSVCAAARSARRQHEPHGVRPLLARRRA